MNTTPRPKFNVEKEVAKENRTPTLNIEIGVRGETDKKL
jgi:hypothetical protein